MGRRIVECVANFSEGRDRSTVGALVSAVARGPDLVVLHHTIDPDHNRSVITFAGEPEAVVAAAVRACSVAAERIDLTRHTGAHPRIGAADVVPFVPIENITLAECAALAHQAGEQIWKTAGVPVYFYEAAALRSDRARLEQVRRGQFEGLRAAVRTDPERHPDVGGPELHPTAGAVAVGARKVLIAFNVNLATEDVTVAKAIARKIRASSGGFPHVKALGLALPSRAQVQVSMNFTDYEETPVHVVYEAIAREAAQAGVDVAGSEIIGLIPRAVLERAAESVMKIENLLPSTVLENRIAEALPLGMRDLLADLESPARAAGGGSAAAMAGAMAASLGALVCRLMKRPGDSFAAHREWFLAGASADAQAFAKLMRAREPAEETIANAAETPLRIAERAVALRDEIAALRADCPDRFVSDLVTAHGLAEAARQGAVSTAALNLASLAGAGLRSAMEARLEAVK